MIPIPQCCPCCPWLMRLWRRGEGTVWEALMHPGQKLKPGAVVRFEGEAGVLMGEVLERRFQGRRTIRLWPEAGGDVLALVESLGHMPLPPYIRRADTADDRDRYQTVYARARGSVAAPTAGLHFTPELLDESTGLGVSAGHHAARRLRDVQADSRRGVEEHHVDAERYVDFSRARRRDRRARAAGRRVMAVGTTTTRALENAARRGTGRCARVRATDLFIYPGRSSFGWSTRSSRTSTCRSRHC